MRTSSMVLRRVLLAFALLVLVSALAAAQVTRIQSRITQAIDDTKLTVLKGNTYPLARPEYDRGPAPSGLQLDRMLLVLQRSPEQEAALESLLDQQQEKSSPNYHSWVTPEQFGEEFGPADHDIQTIESWLGSHGFHVNSIASGRGIIEFSGTAAQVKDAFHTEIHKYEVNEHERWANSTDPEIPSALAAVVGGIASLNSFPRKPLHRIFGSGSTPKATGRRSSVSTGGPFFTAGGGCGLRTTVCYAVTPYDFATIYNILPLWNANPSIDGTGQTIAIVGQSDIYPQDVSNFRSDFGLPAPNLNIIYNGPHAPKLPTEGDETESDLDVEWSSAIAKGATIDFVVSASTNSSAGVDLSAEYIVDNDLAPVMSESYGACELDMGSAGNQFYNQLWQQAAAEGITVFVSTGDSGSTVCDRGAAIATQGLSVNGIASTPYDVAVGGTDFNDLQDPGTYWSSTNNSVTQASALSYIPEMTWNDSCTNSEFFQFTGATTSEGDCNDSTSAFWPNFLVPVGGSGGASNCISSINQLISSCSGGYPKPLWQSGSGVPHDQARDVPDVSLFAGDGINASFYVVCETDIYGGCADDVYSMVPIGGTSASAPAFAAIMAMVNQKTQSRQGNANYVLYPLAAQPGASCNSSGSPVNTCVFYDVTSGTIAMPCTTGTPNCVTSVSGDQNGILSGFSATAGYDLATGLGSVNVANLVNGWNSISFHPTVSTLSLSPTSQIMHGSPVHVTVAVAPATGTGAPTGMVSLLTSAGPNGGIFTLSGGSVSANTGLLPGGTYAVTAHYAGDGTYAASDSSPGIPITVEPEPSVTTAQAYTLGQNGNSVPFTTGPYGGSYVYLRTTVAGQSGEGAATGTINVTANATSPGILGGNALPLNNEGYAVLVGATISPYPFLSPGAYSITASYSGDASFNPSNSQPLLFTVTKAQPSLTTSVVTTCSSPCVLPPGTDVEVNAIVSSNTSVFSIQPTGTITFYDNGTQLGSSVAIDPNEAPPGASFQTNQLPLGQNVITARYSGDANYAGTTTSSSSTIDIASPPTFAITANPMVIGISGPGRSGATTLTFAGQSGFNGSVALSASMCSNLPPESTCTFSPSSVTLTPSSTTVPIILTIATTGSGVVVPATFATRLGTTLESIVFGLAVIWILKIATKHQLQKAILMTIALSLIATIVACGGGSNGGSTGGGNLGTPVGNYTGVGVVVTIGGVTQSINNLSVDVQ